MDTIKFFQKRLEEDFHNVRPSAGDMKEVLNEMFGTNPPGIVMKFSEIERRIRARELNDPAEIMRELQKVLCEIAGMPFHSVDRVPEEGKKTETDDLKKELAYFAAESGCTCPPPFSWEKGKGPCLRCRALAWLVGR